MDVEVATSRAASVASAARRFRSRPWLTGALAFLGLLGIFLLVFDWNWLRHPLERYISNKTQREFRAGHLDVELGLVPLIKLKDVYFANAPWSNNAEPTATIGTLEFSVSLRDVWETKKIYIPRATLSDADLQLERATDLKKNWVLKEPDRSAEPSRVRIGSISVNTGRLRYVNHANPFAVDIVARPAAAPAASAPDSRFTTRLQFSGQFRKAEFSGQAITGHVISLRGTHLAFPVKGSVVSTANRLEIEGSMTDVIERTAADLDLRLSGPSLAGLRSVLGWALPASAPYGFRGHLRKNAAGYVLEDLSGKVGSSDVHGAGEYKDDGSRPLLRAALTSKNLNIADLVNKESVPGAGKPPSGESEEARFGAIDAEVKYATTKLQLSRALPVEDMKFVFTLKDAVARLSPLEVGFAGGRIVSEVMFDARDKKLARSTLNADFRRLQLSRLLPAKDERAKPEGALGAQIRLSGTGNSLSALAASANGSITAALAGGRISNVMDAALGMNGGKVLSLLVGGDKGVNVNCAGLQFDVSQGIGRSRLFVVDTAQTRVDGGGVFNLNDEKFAFTLTPQPKKPGILSMRTPVYLHGTFSEPHASFDKSQMALRAGGALALALINPIAALLPLIETGSGTETDCERVLASVPGARQQAARQGAELPRRVASDEK
jgi:AsmA family protein